MAKFVDWDFDDNGHMRVNQIIEIDDEQLDMLKDVTADLNDLPEKGDDDEVSG